MLLDHLKCLKVWKLNFVISEVSYTCSQSYNPEEVLQEVPELTNIRLNKVRLTTSDEPQYDLDGRQGSGWRVPDWRKYFIYNKVRGRVFLSIRTIIGIHPLITDIQTNTLNW